MLETVLETGIGPILLSPGGQCWLKLSTAPDALVEINGKRWETRGVANLYRGKSGDHWIVGMLHFIEPGQPFDLKVPDILAWDAARTEVTRALRAAMLADPGLIDEFSRNLTQVNNAERALKIALLTKQIHALEAEMELETVS